MIIKDRDGDEIEAARMRVHVRVSITPTGDYRDVNCVDLNLSQALKLSDELRRLASAIQAEAEC